MQPIDRKCDRRYKELKGCSCHAQFPAIVKRMEKLERVREAAEEVQKSYRKARTTVGSAKWHLFEALAALEVRP